ncbi:MAG: pyridoxamine 5'-phosphate oxidase family protein, partial [Pseudomonadota bacterium]
MAEFFDTLDEKHVAMIEAQPVFFVATAAVDGRINLSPKGYDAFRVLSPTQVAYLDLGGSGNETHAHVMADQPDKGRITLMFCNFQQPALILR